MSRPRLLAYIDEAGQRSGSTNSSDHFVMSAVVWKETWDSEAVSLLASMRSELGRGAGQVLHFVKLSHHDRLAVTKALGSAGRHLMVVSVCVCKRHLPPPRKGMTEDHVYLWCYRLLLERLSWLARDNGCDLSLTLAHVVRFKKAKLREYEDVLRNFIPDCKVHWDNVPRGAAISTPKAEERLQLADIAASATFQAFEPRHGFVERRYLDHVFPVLWMRNGNLLSYGLKVHPKPTGEGTYAWCVQAEKERAGPTA